MESAVWLIIYIALGIGLVVGGFWVIAKSGFPKWVTWIFGAVVLVVIVFALVYLVQHRGYDGGPIVR